MKSFLNRFTRVFKKVSLLLKVNSEVCFDKGQAAEGEGGPNDRNF
jgi:hypothetical protein